MQEDNQTMHRQLQDQIEERDRVVTETLHVISESKKQIATNKKAESKSLWKRIFNQKIVYHSKNNNSGEDDLRCIFMTISMKLISQKW